MAIPASSSAVTTIGSNLATAPGASLLSCVPAGGCTITNRSVSTLTVAPGGSVAPSDGVVVRWRIRVGATATSATTPRIIRPVTATTYTGAGTGTTVTPPLTQISTFDTRLPIQAGDYFGVNQAGITASRAGVTGSTFVRWDSPVLGNGAAARSISGPPTNNFEELINADIEADVDGDGYGDETQDLCPNDSTIQADCSRTLTVDAEKGGTVTGPGIDCPGDCSEVFPNKTVVELEAEPDKGFAFSGWNGSPTSCGGSSAFGPCEVTMLSDQTVRAKFGDNDPPQTTLTKVPKRKSTKRKVKFKFRSDEPRPHFQCSLDKKTWGFCKSPLKLKVKTGKHVFEVRAVDAGNLVDTSPAKVKFKVLR